MSLYVITTKSWITPKIWIEDRVLYAQTATLIRFLWLFSYNRHIEVNRRKRSIIVQTQWLWFFTTRKVIPFSRLDRIETKFSSLPTGFGLLGRTDQYEKYTIILRLENSIGWYPLIDFRGHGYVATGWQGVVFGGDSMIDFSRDQESAFQAYYDLLREFTGR